MTTILRGNLPCAKKPTPCFLSLSLSRSLFFSLLLSLSLYLFLSPSIDNSLSMLSLPLFIFIYIYISLTGEEGVHTLFTGQRERCVYKDGKREREKEREKEGGRERELHACASRKCGRPLSIPHSVSMRDYI